MRRLAGAWFEFAGVIVHFADGSGGGAERKDFDADAMDGDAVGFGDGLHGFATQEARFGDGASAGVPPVAMGEDEVGLRGVDSVECASESVGDHGAMSLLGPGDGRDGFASLVDCRHEIASDGVEFGGAGEDSFDRPPVGGDAFRGRIASRRFGRVSVGGPADRRARSRGPCTCRADRV